MLDFFGKQLGELATSTGPTLENLAFRTAWTTRFTYLFVALSQLASSDPTDAVR